MKGLFRKRCVSAGAVIALAAAAPGAASAAPRPASAGPGPCPDYSLSQPFLAWGDSNQYSLLPGESVDNVDGTGWQLSRGAHLVSAPVEDGSAGQVLDMPAGSVVVTPPMCVNASNYPEARAMVSDVFGTEGVAVYVSYQGDGPGGWALATGMIKNPAPGWYPSKPIMLHAGELRGEHTVQFTLVAYGGEYQLYNFYVDPRRSR